jgi:hypothetical protein
LALCKERGWWERVSRGGPKIRMDAGIVIKYFCRIEIITNDNYIQYMTELVNIATLDFDVVHVKISALKNASETCESCRHSVHESRRFTEFVFRN